MDRTLKDKYYQLEEKRHNKKLEELLAEYNTENAFLNHQVNELLRQNLALKGVCEEFTLHGSVKSRYTSRKVPDFKQTSNAFQSQFSEDRIKYRNLLKDNLMGKRKSRYQYIFDEDSSDKINTPAQKKNRNQLQTSESRLAPGKFSQELSYERNPEKTFESIRVNPIKLNKSLQQTSQKYSPQKSLSQSKSKSKRRLDEIQISSRIYEESRKQRLQQSKMHLKQSKIVNKDPYLQQSNILDQSFGRKSSASIIPLESKEPTSNQNLRPIGQDSASKARQNPISDLYNSFLNESNLLTLKQRQSQGVIPLSLGGAKKSGKNQNSRISIRKSILLQQSKAEQAQETVSSKTEPKIKRNHSLNPSPKIQIQGIPDSRKKRQFSSKLKSQLHQQSHAKRMSQSCLKRNASFDRKTYLRVVSTSNSQKKL